VNPTRFVLIALVRGYQWLVPPALRFMTGSVVACRFEPSCSQYAVEALRRHGSVAGTRLSVLRLCRCHPWGGAGLDPVPECLTHAD